MQIPHLETARLRLREIREDDLDDYARMCADPEVMRYLGTGKTLTRDETWRQIAFLLGHWQIRGFGMWALVEKSSGKFVGRVGFHQPEGWPGFEIGWAIDRARWGSGLATEAALALLPLAGDRFGQRHVISLIHPENIASQRVAEKIGETREGENVLHERRVLRYGMRLDA